MKEELPSILISDGWETDENDKLTEIVIPSTVETYQAPTKIKFLGETINWIPSTAAVLQEFEAPNITSLPGGSKFRNFTLLESVKLDKCITIGTAPLSNQSGAYGYGNFQGCSSLSALYIPECVSIYSYVSTSSSGEFHGCSSLTTLNAPKLEILFSGANNVSDCGAFRNCTALQTINAPKLRELNYQHAGGNVAREGCFYSCTALQTVNLPSLQICGSHSFANCTGLTSVTFGSEGHPVTTIASNAFSNCTQSGLHIIVYVADPQNPIANAPWGATNATYEFLQA